MTEKVPRTADEMLAQAMGVAPSTAARVRRQHGSPPPFREADARLKAQAALADLAAAETLDEVDIETAAESEDPARTLRETVERRADAHLRARLAAHVSWAKTEDRAARTAPARAALDAKFLAEAGGDPIRAEHLRKAHYLRLALKSAQARRRRS